MPDIAGTTVAHLPGLALPLRVNAYGFAVQEVDWRDDPAHDERWADRNSAQYGGRQSVWWRQNMERELIRGGQPVWPMLDRDIHVRTIPRSRLLSGGWTLYRGLDHGVRHAECCAWGAVKWSDDSYGRKGDLYLYRQYYATDLPIAMNAKSICDASPPDEPITLTVADPSIFRRDDQTMQRWDAVYSTNGLPLVRADNSARGYENLTSRFVSALARWCLWRNDLHRLQMDLHLTGISVGDARRLATEPAVYFAPETAVRGRSLFEDCANFRWREQTGDPTQRAAPEKYVDVRDEGADVVRYLAQTPAVAPRKASPTHEGEDMVLRILDKAAEPAGSLAE